MLRYPTNEPRDSDAALWFFFSNKDVAWRLYKRAEDIWDFGAVQHLGYMSPRENINGKDIVFRAVGHLSHPWSQSDEKNPVWHATGPTIDVMW